MKQIPLVNGHGVALVDDEDFDRLSCYTWALSNVGYARRSTRADGRSRTILMHREIMGAPAGSFVDHANGSRLDNRRSNLRLTTRSANGANRGQQSNARSSSFKGVCFDRFAGRWKAPIGVRGKVLHLGRFDDEADAARAYDNAARLHFGEMARLNFAEAAA